MTSEQIIAVGKALLPYLRNDLTGSELGSAAHDAANALCPTQGLSNRQRLAIACGNDPYADEKVCSACEGKGYVSSI